MARSLLASVALHAVLAALVWLLGLVGPDRPALPPVYQVDLVSAAEVAPQPTRPEPEPEPEPEEEPEPEPPDAEEKIPEPEETPEKPKPREEKPTPKPGPERETKKGVDLPVTLEGKPFPFPWYLEQLVRKVERNWRPTSNTLSATIHFRIDTRGRIGDVKVEESSGNFLFDQAARRAVEAASPMPPLPDEYSGDWLGVYFVFDTGVRQR